MVGMGVRSSGGEIVARILSFGGLVVVSLLMVVGCFPTTGKYQEIVGSWVGNSETALIRSWGPPNQVYENGSIKYISYVYSDQAYFPGIAPTYQTNIYGNTAYTTQIGGSPPTVHNYDCVTSFEIIDGKITGYTFRGNHCVAY